MGVLPDLFSRKAAIKGRGHADVMVRRQSPTPKEIPKAAGTRTKERRDAKGTD